MAISFTISYVFTPGTTISSSQVNTNTSDVAGVFTGTEALTKTWAKFKVDGDPSTSLEVATKQYVDHYSTYRRPVLQYSSGTVVNMETGLTGTSGQAQILFPDGSLRQDSTSGRINCNLAQVAALSGAWQSGLRTGTVANNTWYAIYAVKTTDDTAKFVAVADTVLPIQSNFATLNSNFNANGWVYLGLVSYGDNKGTANAIISFTMNGNLTLFRNACSGSGTTLRGYMLATATAQVGSTTYTYSAGTSSGKIPNNISNGLIAWDVGASSGDDMLLTDSANAYNIDRYTGTARQQHRNVLACVIDGFLAADNQGTSTAKDIALAGFYDNVLGVGSNPIL